MVRILSALISLLFCVQLAAQNSGFYDPTKPPAAYLLSASAPAASVIVEKPLVLQSVLLSPQRKAAVISGQTVGLGQSIRGYQLRSLGSTQAQLYGPNGMITLKLLSTQPQNAAHTPTAEPDKTLRGDSK